jgi:hypothetical protein
MKNNQERFEQLGTKIDPAMAEVLDAVCNALHTDVYHLLQWFAYTVIRAAAPHHRLSPEIQKVMTLLECDAGWQNAFNLANPDKKRVAQVILILEQESHKGFGAVMIDKPFMGDARQTECVDDILERVCEVTMRGIYRRLRLMGAELDCENLSDILLTMLDMQELQNAIESDRNELPGLGEQTDGGRDYAYGKKTKAKQKRTPDSMANDQRIKFDDYDATTTDEPEKPYGEKADEYLRDLEERARKEAEDGD